MGALLALMPAGAFAGEAEIRIHDGLVSATFDATPASDVVEAIWRAIGLEIVLPPSVQRKTLTLAVDQVLLEPFLQRLVEALDVGGFALVYEPTGPADRLILVDKARASEAAWTPGPRENPSPPPAEAGTATGWGRVSVPVLVPKTEADSMRLGAPGQVMIVQSLPMARTQTSECDGTSAHYPVQTVLVVDAVHTYITGVIVCVPDGLKVGERLIPGPAPPDVPTERESAYSRYRATIR